MLLLFEKLIDCELVSMVFLMDYLLGQCQYVDCSKYCDYYQGKYYLMYDEMDCFEVEQMVLVVIWLQFNCQIIVVMCCVCCIVFVSYDDVIEVYVVEFYQLGSVIVEFFIMLVVVQVLCQYGMYVLMGVLNIVCGGFYFGNVVVYQLVSYGLLDIFLFDYYFVSLLDVVFCIVDVEDNVFILLQVICLVSQYLVQVLGFDDCGVIVEGKCVDLVLVYCCGEYIQIDYVWCQGKRVF